MTLDEIAAAAREVAPTYDPDRPIVYFTRDEWNALEIDLFGSVTPWDERPPSMRAVDLALKFLPDIRKPAPAECWVYFVRQGEAGAVKIGITRNLSERVRTLQTGSPEKLTILFAAPGGVEGVEGEEAIHRHFRQDRMAGEWFKATRDLLEFVQACRHLRPDRKLRQFYAEIHADDGCGSGWWEKVK